jgi:multicomponent Na+:H+ antiporter subunit F
MNTFLVAAAGFVMLTVVVGLLRILYGPGDADRVMAAQLLGTGGVSTLLLVAASSARPAIVDVAMILALLAAFSTIAFVKNAMATPTDATTVRGDASGDRGKQ